MANKHKAAKKEGKDTNKKRQRMREAVAERQRNRAPEKPSTDEVDTIKYKRGSAGDKTVRP
jgi:hypothetical protein